jgi:uncharacterized protein (DUF849 family)
MRAAKKVVITCAVTGSIHTPTMSPYIPITPNEIAEAAIGAAEAGAAVIHLHARDPKDGRPSPDPALFMEFLPRIKQSTNAVLNLTTGGGPGMTIPERLAGPIAAQPELCSLNMGSLNFGVFGLATKYDTWKYDWEKPFLEGSYSSAQSNTFAQIESMIRELNHNFGTRFEFECYDIGHLYTLHWFYRQGLLKPPFFIQFIMGVQGGIGIDLDHLLHMRNTADRLFGNDYLLSCFAIGKDQMKYATAAAMLGGNVRVGLEDSLYIGKGELAVSNAAQVTKIRGVLESLGLEIASPDEAREMLDLKGGDKVAF